jgi:hypothetical protein
MAVLEKNLLEITGMDAITLQPAAGAHGEWTGIMLIPRAAREPRQSSQEDPCTRFGAWHQPGDGRDVRLFGGKFPSDERACWTLPRWNGWRMKTSPP